MDIKRLREDITRHEGKILSVYIDTEGNPTVGIGHLLTAKEIKEYPVGSLITEDMCVELFEDDLAVAISRAKRIVGTDTFETLCPARQEVIVNMAFNLGNRLKRFTKFIAALRVGDYERAANEMIDSLWYHQVGLRADELVERMRSGI